MIIKKGNEYLLIPKPRSLWGIKCIECQRPASETHHCIGKRADRWKSEELGLTVPLCSVCHDKLHNRKEGKELKRKYQKVAQRIFEKTHSRDEWMRIYHKNFLWEEE